MRYLIFFLSLILLLGMSKTYIVGLHIVNSEKDHVVALYNSSSLKVAIDECQNRANFYNTESKYNKLSAISPIYYCKIIQG